ncbi:unnamed protein product [Arabis nemorensis]|uniref:K Homology domain-containing protein n=1 Tax=Arabis nemorensis TaxID=586526 RepID=A0A565C508_9BRAS|nr:unnamed protein product [Arabis nemorensis]
MAEEEVVAAISASPVDLKRKLDEIKPELVEQHAGSNGVTMAASDSSHAKRPKLEDEAADGLFPKDYVLSITDFLELVNKKDENQDSEPLVKQIKELIIVGESENQPADAHVKPEDNQQSYVQAPKSQEDTAEECKDVNGGEPQKEGDGESKGLNDSSFQNEIGKENQEVGGDNSQKEVDNTRSTTRRIYVPNSKVGVLIAKGGETIRYLQINSGAKIQILRDSETDPNSALRPVEIIETNTHIENAENRINAVIVELQLTGWSDYWPRWGHNQEHADKVGSAHSEGDRLKERTVRISGDKRQIDIATKMIKDIMYHSIEYSQPPMQINTSLNSYMLCEAGLHALK